MIAHDSATCTFYYKLTNPGSDANRGRADYVGAGDETSASCNGGGATGLCLTGTGSAPSAGSNFVMYWDDDEWRELEDANSISKATGGTLLTCSQCSGCNGTKNTPTLTADMLGDWREEVIWRETAGASHSSVHNHRRDQAPHLHAHARSDVPGAGELRAGELQPAATHGVPNQPQYARSAGA